ncbi:ninein-like protein isoform X3 [Mizuhopecten yessoensis]|uniref:ninein-like protein isoform X3 n=1 Tax=Mizuhopecten yessoensis TaxID=6573 RepID=UPI000B45DE20|nr:ninein-like protein isoform X3 [Mizuhopecten yessoensis]
METAEIDLEDTDLYISQLREVFDSCDTWEKGYLNRNELIVLCQKLQLSDQADDIIDQLLQNIGALTRRNANRKVTFEQFKNTFVHILCQTAARINQETHQDHLNTEHDGTKRRGNNSDSDMSDEVTPVYIKDGKRYGRRSKPLYPQHKYNGQDEDLDVKPGKEDGSRSVRRSRGDNPLRESASSLSEEEREMFEAEGQLNLTMCELEQTQDLTEEDYLRNIWKTLGVGQRGYITLSDLSAVCDHIGMDEMDDDELQQLFDKLDSDADGKVSFNEFLHGLQHSAPPACPATPRSLGTPTPRTHSAQKKIKVMASASAEERLTPSIVLGSGVSGIFTTLDPTNTGFSMPDNIIDLWEKYNVTNGADILLALGFDLNTKVSLSELSSYLEQELINCDDQNAVYQAALSSYQQEIRHLKSTLEQFNWETEKLKQDLSEANLRNIKLAKEVDERHAHMEQSTERKLLTVEKKYHDQVKMLQSELEHEREQYSTQAVTQKTVLEGEMEQLRQEDRKLRESLAQAQKEIERLERDLIDSVEKRTDVQKQNSRLQKELQSVNDLQRKLDEFESIGVLSPEEKKVTEEKIERVKSENKDLKDRNDELTAELEMIKQQFPTLKKKERSVGPSPRGFGSRIPVREGSLLSDYIKAGRRGIRSSLSSETSDDETQSSGSTGLTPNYTKRTRRKLPQAPDDEDAGNWETRVSSIQNDREQIENLKKELIDLKNHMEKEHKEIEHTYREKLSKMEESHDNQKVELLKKFEQEKSDIYEECEHIKQTELAARQQQLQNFFAKEKQDMMDKHEYEKSSLNQRFVEEKDAMIKSLQVEYAQDLEVQVTAVQEDYARDKAELEAYITNPNESQLQQLEQEKAELEEKLFEHQEEMEHRIEEARTRLREELEATKEEEILKLKSQFENESAKMRTDINVNSQNDIHRLEVKFEEEKTKLRVDFESAREEDKSEFDLNILQQREELEARYNKERENLEEKYEDQLRRLNDELQAKIKEYENSLSEGVDALKGKTKEDFFNILSSEKDLIAVRQKEEVSRGIEKEKVELEGQYTSRIQELEQAFAQEKEELRDRYEGQIVGLRSQLERLTVRLDEEREAMEERFEEERETLEEELARTIKEELEDEFTQQVEQLKASFESEKVELHRQIDMYQEETEELQKDLEQRETSVGKEEELRLTISTLKREKQLAEKAQEEAQRNLEENKSSLESRIESLLTEREEVITAVKASEVHLAKESVDKHSVVVKEKVALEKEVSKLRRHALELQVDNQRLSALQETAYNDWDQEKTEYVQRIQELEAQLKDHATELIPPHAQNVIDSLRRERDDLDHTLASAKQKFQDVDDRVKKMTEQQMAFNSANSSMSSENKNLQVKVELLNNDLGETNSSLEREKEKMMALQLEKERLENELTKVSYQLEDTSQKLADHKADHESEISKLKDMNSNSIDPKKFTMLQGDLVDHQRQLRDLHDALEAKENEKNRTFKVKEEEINKIMESLEEDKVNLRRKLRLTQEMLDEQLEKIKSHYSDCDKRNLLVVDLYKENADMMESLFMMEEKKKDAVSRCYKLEDQCKTLRKMLKKVVHVTIT